MDVLCQFPKDLIEYIMLTRDTPIMVHTIGSTISKVENSLAEGMEEIVGTLYEYINKGDEC